MPNIKTGVPIVSELREGVTEYRYVPGKGLISYTKYNNKLYSSKQFPSSTPPVIDKKARTVINNSETINITTTSDGTGGTSSLDIDELNALSGTGLHQTQDHFVFSDNGTEKKITFSNLEDAIFSNMNSASSDVSVAAGGAITIANDAVSLAKMAGLVRGKFIVGDASGNPSALAAGANGKILVADANGDPSWTTLDGDASISAGTLAISSDVIVNADVKTDAAIAVSKLALTAGDGLTLNTNDMDLDAALTTVTSIKNNSLIIGGNSQNNTIDFGTDDVILFDTDNTERMRVDAAGVDVTGTITATGNITIADAGTIGSTSDTDAIAIASGGDVTFSQDIKLGTYSNPNFSNGLIGSSSFTSGFAGSGWQINHSSNDFTIELDNMFIRGTLSVYELLIQQIRATNGAVFVTSAAKVESVSGLSTTDDDGYITFEDPNGTNICPFAVGDIIMMQRIVPGALVAGNAAGNATNVIKKCVYKVTHIGQFSTNNVATVTNISYDNLAIPVAGDEFVRIGNVGDSSGGDDDRRGLLYLTSDDSNAPFMDVKDEVDSYADWHSTSTTKVRVGKLSGITDAGLNGGSALSGYGLYGGNVFLKGAINATSGHIGANASGANGWVIAESKISSTDSSNVIGLVQDNAAHADVGGISSFYAGATASTGAGAKISFGSDGKIRGNGIYIKGGVEYLITASRIFGNGSDGALTLSSDTQTSSIDSVNWVASGILQRDIYATNLTINAGVNIKTGGYRIFVRDTLIINGSGTSLYNVGSAGDNGSNGTNDAQGAGGSGSGAGGLEGSLKGGVAGGNGGNGGDAGTQSEDPNGDDGSAGTAGGSTSNCIRRYSNNAGGRGANGAGSGGGSGAGGSSAAVAGSSTDGKISITNADLSYIIAMRDFFTIDGTSPSLLPAAGSSGGGGGGGGDYVSGSGGGGGGGGQGGGSGGHVMVVARQITGTLSNLTLAANGGNGGNGGSAGTAVGSGTGGIGAGGNGGDGGCVTLITGTDPGTSGSGGIIRNVSGGTKGNQGVSGGSVADTAASDGEDGTALTIQV